MDRNVEHIPCDIGKGWPYRISSKRGGAAQEVWIEAWIGGEDEDEASEVRACMATRARARTEVLMGKRVTRIRERERVLIPKMRGVKGRMKPGCFNEAKRKAEG